ncbi:alpha/beta hydrolase [Solimonas soli]|uniref:alpha/beta hydrolase n=1 Tax=Solimonas soli TaxID=413479 RepID=UPI000481B43B|nr:alpha/beta fold hydrolase [Solimonas soli]
MSGTNSNAGDLLPAAGQSRTLLIQGPAGRLELQINAPAVPRAGGGCAVVCHPHPLAGGMLSNKVTYTLASCAQKAGLHALRFNFRGVGKSEGTHDEGRGETDDTVFVAEWLRARLPPGPLLLAGFSFGAWVSVAAAARLSPALQISVAPPFAKYFANAAPPARPPCPWLVVHGRDDDVVGYDETMRVLQGYAPPPQIVSLDGVGHFFHNRLADLAAAVQPFIEAQLGAMP